VSCLLEDLGGPERFVVVDMEASPEHLSRGTVRHVDAICLVAEPYYRSLETVRRMAALVAELPVSSVSVVANKVRFSQDEQAISEFCDRHGSLSPESSHGATRCSQQTAHGYPCWNGRTPTPLS